MTSHQDTRTQGQKKTRTQGHKDRTKQEQKDRRTQLYKDTRTHFENLNLRFVEEMLTSLCWWRVWTLDRKLELFRPQVRFCSRNRSQGSLSSFLPFCHTWYTSSPRGASQLTGDEAEDESDARRSSAKLTASSEDEEPCWVRRMHQDEVILILYGDDDDLWASSGRRSFRMNTWGKYEIKAFQ